MIAEIDHTSTLSPLSATDAQAWFAKLYGDKPLSRGRICIHGNAKFDKPEYFVSTADAAGRAGDFERDVYALIGVTASTATHGRGKAEDVVALPALFVDVDCYDGKGPDTIDEAIEILDTLPVKPNLIVASGGGVHAYWVFDAPWYFETTSDAAKMLYGWSCEVKDAMLRRDSTWKLDSVFDLARVLRVPGFANSKKTGQKSSIIRNTGESYTPNDFILYAKARPDRPAVNTDFDIEEIELRDELREMLEAPTKLGALWRHEESVTPGDGSQSCWDMAILIEAATRGVTDPSDLWAIMGENRGDHVTDPDKMHKRHDRGYAKRTIGKAIAAAASKTRPDPSVDFPVIPRVLLDHQEDNVVSAIVDHLAKLGREIALPAIDADRLTLYQRGGVLTRVSHGQDGEPTLEALPLEQIGPVQSRTCEVYKYIRDDKTKVVELPLRTAKAIQTRGVFPTSIQPIEQVARTPILRPDGTIFQTRGYDPETRSIYRPNAEFPTIPESASADMARRLVNKHVMGLLYDFPFVGEDDLSAAISLILTVLARPAIDGCTPFFASVASAAGTGKGNLLKIAGIFATGKEPNMQAYVHNAAESQKTINSILMARTPMHVFDNVAMNFGSPAIDAVATTQFWSDRIMSQSKMSSVPNRTVWTLSGNNISYIGDTARRVLPIRMLSRLARPQDRSGFRYGNILDAAKASRPHAVSACLAAVRGYIAAGMPNQTGGEWGSFEAWSKLIRGTVCWMGFADPLTTRSELLSSDATTDHHEILVRAMLERSPNREWVTTSGILGDAWANETTTPASAALLSEVLENKADPKKLGFKLRALKNRVFEIADGDEVERVWITGKRTHGASMWRIESVA